MLGCCLVSFHFLSYILCSHSVLIYPEEENSSDLSLQRRTHSHSRSLTCKIEFGLSSFHGDFVVDADSDHVGRERGWRERAAGGRAAGGQRAGSGRACFVQCPRPEFEYNAMGTRINTRPGNSLQERLRDSA